MTQREWESNDGDASMREATLPGWAWPRREPRTALGLRLLWQWTRRVLDGRVEITRETHPATDPAADSGLRGVALTS